MQSLHGLMRKTKLFGNLSSQQLITLLEHSKIKNSITNFQHSYAEEDDLIVEDLVQNATELSEADVDKIKSIALSEPMLINRQISPSGHVTGVIVNFLLPGKSMEESPEVAESAHKIAQNLNGKYPDLDRSRRYHRL